MGAGKNGSNAFFNIFAITGCILTEDNENQVNYINGLGVKLVAEIKKDMSTQHNDMSSDLSTIIS